MTRRLMTVTALLIIGVAMVGVSAETHQWGWAVAGYLALLFVPALIVDDVREGRK